MVSPDYISWVSSVPLRFLYYLNFRGLTLSISSRFEKITSRPFGPMCLSLFLDQYFSQVFSTLQISIRFHFLLFSDLSEGKVVKTSLNLLTCKRQNSVICIFLCYCLLLNLKCVISTNERLSLYVLSACLVNACAVTFIS